MRLNIRSEDIIGIVDNSDKTTTVLYSDGTKEILPREKGHTLAVHTKNANRQYDKFLREQEKERQDADPRRLILEESRERGRRSDATRKRINTSGR